MGGRGERLIEHYFTMHLTIRVSLKRKEKEKKKKGFNNSKIPFVGIVAQQFILDSDFSTIAGTLVSRH